MHRTAALTLLLLLLCPGLAGAQRRAFTEDKREVLLFDDGTWRYAGSLEIDKTPHVMPPPPWSERLARDAGPAATQRLRRVSARRNQITDDDRWLAKNGLSLPRCQVPNPLRGLKGDCPPAVPSSYRGLRLVEAIRGPKRFFLIYGPDFSTGRTLVVTDRAVSQVEAVLDFSAYLRAPRGKAADARFVVQGINWVWSEGDTLYLSHGHRTYASSSAGMNAYITAIDLPSRKLLWRSRPLVAGARSFEVLGDVIVTGYGFTAEPDYLYLLDRGSGRVLQRIKLKTGPTYIIAKGNQIHVRTYNMDYVYALTSGSQGRRGKQRKQRRSTKTPVERAE